MGRRRRSILRIRSFSSWWSYSMRSVADGEGELESSLPTALVLKSVFSFSGVDAMMLCCVNGVSGRLMNVGSGLQQED